MNKTLLRVCLLAAICAPVIAEEDKPIQWPDRITIKGDLRLREELTKQEGQNDRNRIRLRARIQAEAKINDEVKGVLGLASGSDDPISTNQTLGDEFSHKPIRLDLAYLEWSPAVLQEAGIGKLTLAGGKMRNPFLLVDELIWDSDVNPEGFAGGLKTSPLEGLDVMLNGGAMWYIERSSDLETMLYTGQVGFKLKNEKGYYCLLGGSLYQFSNVEDYGAFDWEGKNNFYGNSSKKVVSNGVTNLVYACGFQEWEGMVEVGAPIPMTKIPFKIYGNYINNAQANSNNGNGYQAGIQLNDLKDKDSFMVSYAYRELQADATMGAMTDADWWGGGTDGKGHRLQAGYQILKNWSLNLTCFFNNKRYLSSNPKDFQRFQVDLNAKF